VYLQVSLLQGKLLLHGCHIGNVALFEDPQPLLILLLQLLLCRRKGDLGLLLFRCLSRHEARQPRLQPRLLSSKFGRNLQIGAAVVLRCGWNAISGTACSIQTISSIKGVISVILCVLFTIFIVGRVDVIVVFLVFIAAGVEIAGE
jgi:hypothetical protein